MDTKAKDKIRAMITRDYLKISNQSAEIKRTLNDNLKDTLEYFHSLVEQLSQSALGPLVTLTPQVTKKNRIQRIETIPENQIVDNNHTISDSIAINVKEEDNVSMVGRAKRKASEKAVHNMREQQSFYLNKKLRRPSDMTDIQSTHKKKQGSKVKRKNSSSLDEDIHKVPEKHSKQSDTVLRESEIRKAQSVKVKEKQCANDTIKNSGAAYSISSRRTNIRSSMRNHETEIKHSNSMDDTIIAPTREEVEEASMYEDALGKLTPIMNSTMNLNSSIVVQKMMNATVILEPLAMKKLNETVTLKKKSLRTNHTDMQYERKTRSKETAIGSSQLPKVVSPAKNILPDEMQNLKETMANKEFDELITYDESSPEMTKRKVPIKKPETRKRQRQQKKLLSSSEDEVSDTPAKSSVREIKTASGVQEIKNAYKTNALFSPYAKESVRKRVEAFEQVGMNSPKPAVEIDAPTRITRTKTRAIAAAQAESSESAKEPEKTVAQKLARKSLARARKISLAKQVKQTDEYKKNIVNSAQTVKKLIPIEKVYQNQQPKTTPIGKSKLLPFVPVNRLLQTPSSQIMSNTKVSSATRGNIVTHVDSFLQPPKTASKSNSVDKLEERKRKVYDEDARRKREEALKLQTEEKRRKRQEKELKNKLARDAKEKQELEKRLKFEKEKEEKARLAQQMQEKQREEIERKRQIQLQRAQEKEERRKLEDQQRIQRLQEQEQAERLLAEQRRREQEVEKKREADARSQQQAGAEAARLKHQMLQTQVKQANSSNKNHGPTNYILDSEPDDDESDDESRPKYAIPYWAQSHKREAHLAMQSYIPVTAVFKFFDTKKCTPDLTELFQGIDRSRLKRTSSAIWTTPPRFSMMDTRK